MGWSLTSTDKNPKPGSAGSDDGSGGTIEDALARNVVTAKLDDMIAWGRKHSMWPFNFGLSCCYVEMATALTAPHDMARFGSEVIRATYAGGINVIEVTMTVPNAADLIRQTADEFSDDEVLLGAGTVMAVFFSSLSKHSF